MRDLAALRAFAAHWLPPERAAIEPGADELGMILTGAAFAHEAHVVPRIRVRYSRAGAATERDPLEFNSIDTTIGDIIAACGAVRAPDGDAGADIDLFVRVKDTSAPDEAAFVDAIAAETADGAKLPRPAVADLTFLASDDMAQQRALVEAMIARGIAGKIDAFASWNTTANTIGTAVPAAIAALVGRATHDFDPVAHAQFMLDRYADDYAFHDFVRGAVNAELSQRGIADHTYLLPDAASFAGSENRAALWPRALAAAELDLPALPRHGPDDHAAVGPNLRDRARRAALTPAAAVAAGRARSARRRSSADGGRRSCCRARRAAAARRSSSTPATFRRASSAVMSLTR